MYLFDLLTNAGPIFQPASSLPAVMKFFTTVTRVVLSLSLVYIVLFMPSSFGVNSELLPITEEESSSTRRQLAVTPLTDTNFQTACDAWVDNPTISEEEYGAIADWDTSDVTTMEGAFASADSFNDDISRWNTNKVTSMHGVSNEQMICCLSASRLALDS
jgi:surface protein